MIKIGTKNKHTKIQSNIFIFDCAVAKKTGKGDDVIFLRRVSLAFIIVVHKNKSAFRNPEIKLHKIGMFL